MSLSAAPGTWSAGEHAPMRPLWGYAIPPFLLVLPLVLIRQLHDRWWIAVLLIPAILVAWIGAERGSSAVRSALLGLLAGVVVTFGLGLARNAGHNVKAPPEYDVQQFWIHGRVAAQGLNVYEMEHSHALAKSMNASDEMMGELHFWYPPPALFMFLPLGWVSLKTASAIWYTVLFLAFAADVWLLWTLFLRR